MAVAARDPARTDPIGAFLTPVETRARDGEFGTRRPEARRRAVIWPFGGRRFGLAAVRPRRDAVRVWKGVRAWIFPVACIGCGTSGTAFCSGCGPSAAERTRDFVAETEVTAAGPYTGLLRRAILAMKGGERDYLDPFAALLAAITLPGIPLVPLPTSRRRAAGRGFDQGIELARRAARLADAPCMEVLEKRGNAQRGLNRRARLAAGGRFRIKRGVALSELAVVVDDVCTTGATLADGIATLRAAGVAVIGAVVVARTPPGRNSRSGVEVLSHGDYRREGADPV